MQHRLQGGENSNSLRKLGENFVRKTVVEIYFVTTGSWTKFKASFKDSIALKVCLNAMPA